MEEEKFTIEEFEKYLLSQDSFGDALYFLSVENINKANQDGDDEDELID